MGCEEAKLRLQSNAFQSCVKSWTRKVEIMVNSCHAQDGPLVVMFYFGAKQGVFYTSEHGTFRAQGSARGKCFEHSTHPTQLRCPQSHIACNVRLDRSSQVRSHLVPSLLLKSWSAVKNAGLHRPASSAQ